MKKEKSWLIVLIGYVSILFFIGVLNREPDTSNTIKLALFWGYSNPPQYIYRDNLINIISFIPIGFLAGLLFKKQNVLKALLVGLSVSLVIECSQLIWNRGTFDVDDLFNNTLGAVIGGGIVWLMVRLVKVNG